MAPERCDERCERLGRDGIGERGCFRREQHLHAGLVRDEDVVDQPGVERTGAREQIGDRVLAPEVERDTNAAEAQIEIDDAHASGMRLRERDRECRGHGRRSGAAFGRVHGDDHRARAHAALRACRCVPGHLVNNGEKVVGLVRSDEQRSRAGADRVRQERAVGSVSSDDDGGRVA